MSNLTAPRFSVLIPAHNAARFLPATLRSISKQDVASLEVVVMDGASTDGTADIAAAYPGLAMRVTSEPDRGQLDAVHKAVRAARGEILYWLNADDVLLPGTLAVVDAAFRADPALDLVFSDDFAFDEDRRLLVNGGLIKGLSYADHALFYRQMFSECIFWKRERTRLLPESDHDLRITTDYAFFLNLRRGLKERWLDKRLGAFRMTAGQISQTARNRHAGEFARVRRDAYARNRWSPLEVSLRRAVHAPSFWARQRLRPALHAAGRALRRRIDGGARRRAMTAAFFDEWLGSDAPASAELVELLWR